MPKTSFVRTDPSFIVVSRAVGELERQNNCRIVGYTEATSNGIRGNDDDDVYKFKHWNGFTRTAGSVMRLYMLNATDMLRFHNPNFRIAKQRNINAMEYSKHIGPADGNPIDMAADANEARDLSAQFDRQYPHFILENHFRGMDVGTTRSHRGRMYVVDLQNRTLYEVTSTLRVKLNQQYPFMIIEAIPFVTVYKVHLQNLPPNFQDLDPESYKYTRLLQELITEFNNLNLELIQGLQAVNLNDSDESDEEGEGQEEQEEQQEEEQGQEE